MIYNRIHEKVGKEIVKNKIDVLICSGENSKYIIESVKNSSTKTIYFENKKQIIEKLQKELKNGDVVLVKASNAMKFYEICQKL